MRFTASTAWLIIIPTLLPITLSLTENYLTSVLLNLLTWNQEKNYAIKTIHSTNTNPITFWVSRGLVITAGINAVGFVSHWKQRKKIFVAGTIPKFQEKTIIIFGECSSVHDITKWMSYIWWHHTQMQEKLEMCCNSRNFRRSYLRNYKHVYNIYIVTIRAWVYTTLYMLQILFNKNFLICRNPIFGIDI